MCIEGDDWYCFMPAFIGAANISSVYGNYKVDCDKIINGGSSAVIMYVDNGVEIHFDFDTSKPPTDEVKWDVGGKIVLNSKTTCDSCHADSGNPLTQWDSSYNFRQS